MKIIELTKEQEARFPEYVQRWTEIGLSTESADRRAAEAAIDLCYGNAGLKPPQQIIWSGSPLSQAITRAVMRRKDEIQSAARSIPAERRADHNLASLQEAIHADLGQAQGLPEALRDQLIEDAQSSVNQSIYGQHDAGWLSFYAFFREVCGLRKETEKLTGLLALAQSAGWAIPHENVCFVAERHNLVRRDSEGRLHAEFGPALTYPDGWGFHMLHGIRVEAWMAETHPDDLDPRKIIQIENVDQRREVIRRLGSERLVAKLEAKTLDAETREVGGKYELLAIEMNHGAPWHFLKMRNASIDAVHIEAVPRECLTVREAINWRASQNKNHDWFPSQLS